MPPIYQHRTLAHLMMTLNVKMIVITQILQLNPRKDKELQVQLQRKWRKRDIQPSECESPEYDCVELPEEMQASKSNSLH